MAKRSRHAEYFMMYGCLKCGKGCRMYIDTGLGLGTKTMREHYKPVPMTITCPFCGSHDFVDVSGPCKLKHSVRLNKHMPSFWDVPGDDCGKPMNMDQAKVEYTKAEPAPEDPPSDG